MATLDERITALAQAVAADIKALGSQLASTPPGTGGATSLIAMTMAALDVARDAGQLQANALVSVADKKTVALCVSSNEYRLLEAPIATFTTGWDANKMASGVVLLDSQTVASFPGAGQRAVLSQVGHSTGKHYAEVVYYGGNASGDCSVGVAHAGIPLNSQVGYNGGGQEAGLFQNSGNIYADGKLERASSRFAASGSVVCVAYDADARMVFLRVDEGPWTGDPAVGFGGVSPNGTDQLFLAVCTPAGAAFRGVFEGPFHYSPPPGYGPWSGT